MDLSARYNQTGEKWEFKEKMEEKKGEEKPGREKKGRVEEQEEK